MSYHAVHDLFTAAATRAPHAVAVERGAERHTYAELEARSNAVAHRLLRDGVGPGVPVGIYAADPVVVITAVLAVLKAGGVFVPLDPRLPAARLAAMLAVVGPARFVVQAATAAPLAELVDGGAAVRAPFAVCVDAALLEADPAGLSIDRSPALPGDEASPGLAADADAVCDVFFTSGSTGEPKGIAGRLRGIDHFVRWEAGLVGAGPGTRGSQLASPSFDSFLRDVFLPLTAGGTVVVPESAELASDARALVRWIDDAGITVLHCVPSVFRAILSRELHPALFGSLTHVVMAGEPLHPADVDRWMTVFGERVRLVNLYGPTETTMTKLFHVVADDDRRRRTVPIGRAIPGAQVAVMDEQGAACPAGAVGEIWIRTPYRAHGYWNRPELTARSFVPNPRTGDPADVLYRTGDLGRMREDGALEFVGRRDHQVKIRGVRVEPAEVEAALCAHPAVADAAVRDWDDREGGKSLAAYVVPDGELSAGEVRAHLLALLPEALVPSAFVMMRALPRTPNGKTDRAALPEPSRAAAAGVPRERVAPASEIESVLAALWCEVLETDGVGVTDDFFEVGGHSLRMARVAAAVEETFAVEVPLRAFFESPTVRGQAAVLVAAEPRPGRTADVARMFMQVAEMSADEIANSLRADAPVAAN